MHSRGTLGRSTGGRDVKEDGGVNLDNREGDGSELSVEKAQCVSKVCGWKTADEVLFSVKDGKNKHKHSEKQRGKDRWIDMGRNSSVGSVWARCPQRRGFDPPLGTFSGRGDFSLGVNMGSNSIPPKTLSDESINRGLVCAHMHFIARTQKILTFMS